MRILLTGISSFTGFWFARNLVAKGHEVIGTLSGPLERYSGLRARRIEPLKSICNLVTDVPFGSDAFLRLVSSRGPWDLFCRISIFIRRCRQIR
jgi:nucleoside-diphosphate-sugar epimerase